MDVLPVDATAPDQGALNAAAEVLRRGGLVAFPTETVYGLGANALDALAVKRIFQAKGRPASNPVIVHIPRIEDARPLVADWPPAAETLARHFWPGPLSLVLIKSEIVPPEVTAGGPTVALRVPAHPVARELLETCGFPLAAPSANPANQLSPTRGDHVRKGLEDQVDLLLDAGGTSGGLESTVLDVTRTPPRLLRPGLVTAAQLEALIGPIEQGPFTDAGPARSPGQQPRHYAPRTSLELVASTGLHRVEELRHEGKKVGWLSLEPFPDIPGVVQIAMPADPAQYAARLYSALHDLDDRALDRIIVALPPAGDDWQAVQDRLRRAAG